MEHIQVALDKMKRKSEQILFRDPATIQQLNPGADSNWSNLPVRTPDVAVLAANRIVTATRADPTYASFDMLRTRVLRELQRHNWTSIAITSPTVACGKSLVSINLAFSLAHRKECRVVLLDMDMNHSRMDRLLGLRNMQPVERFLRGELPAEEVFVRCADNLAIATNVAPVRFSSELLQNPRTTEILADMKRRFRPTVVIHDMPPMLCSDALMAFLPNVDCAILVVAAEMTKLAELDLCEQELSAKSNLLGVVLNKCRYMPEKYGY